VRYLSVLGLVVILASIGACGSKDSGEKDSTGQAISEDAVKAKAESDAASVSDPNFIGSKTYDVSCSGEVCTVKLGTDLLRVPLLTDKYHLRKGQIEPTGGQSLIVNFLQNDAERNCMWEMADTQDLRALLPCLWNRPGQ
jgi:hypothetical protein